MRPLILCLERLYRIRRVLSHLGGDASLRDLWRSWVIYDWEIEQAAEMGWLQVYTYKPSGRGRPSRRAKLCDEGNAKLPKPRRMIPKEISIRHELFAMRSVFQATPRGMREFGIPPVISVYMALYRPKSRAGAAASCSRLMRRPDVRAAREWFYARLSGEVPRGEAMPRTRQAIRLRFEELGLWRIRRL